MEIRTLKSSTRKCNHSSRQVHKVHTYIHTYMYAKSRSVTKVQSANTKELHKRLFYRYICVCAYYTYICISIQKCDFVTVWYVRTKNTVLGDVLTLQHFTSVKCTCVVLCTNRNHHTVKFHFKVRTVSFFNFNFHGWKRHEKQNVYTDIILHTYFQTVYCLLPAIIIIIQYNFLHKCDMYKTVVYYLHVRTSAFHSEILRRKV